MSTNLVSSQLPPQPRGCGILPSKQTSLTSCFLADFSKALQTLHQIQSNCRWHGNTSRFSIPFALNTISSTDVPPRLLLCNPLKLMLDASHHERTGGTTLHSREPQAPERTRHNSTVNWSTEQMRQRKRTDNCKVKCPIPDHT